MDGSGKMIYAKNTEIVTVNLQTVEPATLQDGARVVTQIRDLGTTEVYPQALQHSPNGRYVAVIGDGEYIIYTSLAWRNKAFGSGTSFAWHPDSNSFAVRQTVGGRIQFFKQFKEKSGFFQNLPNTGVDAVFGGALLGGIGNGFVCFWDWETGALARRIDVDAHNVSLLFGLPFAVGLTGAADHMGRIRKSGGHPYR